MNTERTHRVASMLSWWVARRRESTSSTCGWRNADLSASSHSTPSVPCCAACEEGTSIPCNAPPCPAQRGDACSEYVMAQVDGMGRIASSVTSCECCHLPRSLCSGAGGRDACGVLASAILVLPVALFPAGVDARGAAASHTASSPLAFVSCPCHPDRAFCSTHTAACCRALRHSRLPRFR